MATSMPNPDPSQGAAPPAGGPPTPPPQGGAQPPSQGQASQIQQLMAQWSQVAHQIAASDPRLAAPMEKISQAIQEAQTALVSPPQPTPTSQQPSYA